MDEYPAIEEHGLIGDLQTAALVTRGGSIDWFCAPRFDSPSIFGALVDREHGGHFTITPEGVDYVSKQLYLPDTAIVITRFLSETGVGELIDFMPIAGDKPTDRHRIVRLVRAVRGTIRFRMECVPAFDYGRARHEVDIQPEGVVFHSPGNTLTLHAAREGGPLIERDGIRRTGNGVSASLDLTEGQRAGVILETEGPGKPQVVSSGQAIDLFEHTRDFWRQWIGRCKYRGRWREMVERSAMTLKLMTYAPTGALVAAPTAGLPEQVGGERNWDYRYTWIRDASFSVHALMGLGYTEEAGQFLFWLRDRIREATEAGKRIQIMYRIDGSADLDEEVLEHFEGYRGSRPVRIGNGAAGQLQLDIFGEAMDAVYLADKYGLRLSHQGWSGATKILDWLADNWDQPDDGIWETRGGKQDFTYGRLMCWVAFDRAIRLAVQRGLPANLVYWMKQRDAIYNQVMDRGFHEKRAAFVQHYHTDVLDASLLYMPRAGFIAPTDPMWRSTLKAMDEELVSDSLVYRYNPSASPDGLRGSEGTFTICSFWYVIALAESGRINEARLTFEKMLTYASPLGLYSEEIALTGEQIGNFPQAFSHLSLISAAIELDRALS
jgi:GH15 family glucan-1,4-alpha-glucosidase